LSFKVGDRVRVTDEYPGDDIAVGAEGVVVVPRPYDSSFHQDFVGVQLPDVQGLFFAHELEHVRETLSDGSDRVVFEADPILPEKVIQIAFSDKPLLELTKAEARQVLRQLEALV
jgi:hypothetical protein